MVTVNLLLICPVLLHQWSRAQTPEVWDQLIDKGAWQDMSRRSRPTRHGWQYLVDVLGDLISFFFFVTIVKYCSQIKENKESSTTKNKDHNEK